MTPADSKNLPSAHPLRADEDVPAVILELFDHVARLTPDELAIAAHEARMAVEASERRDELKRQAVERRDELRRRAADIKQIEKATGKTVAGIAFDGVTYTFGQAERNLTDIERELAEFEARHET